MDIFTLSSRNRGKQTSEHAAVPRDIASLCDLHPLICPLLPLRHMCHPRCPSEQTMQDRLEQNASESASAAKAARAAVRKQEKSANEKALEQRLKQRQMSRTMLETANQKERARLATVTSKLHTRDDMAERLERMSEYKLQLKQNKFQQQSTNVQEAVMRELNRRYTNGKMSVPRDMAKRWADVTFLSRRKMDSIPLVYKGNL